MSLGILYVLPPAPILIFLKGNYLSNLVSGFSQVYRTSKLQELTAIVPKLAGGPRQIALLVLSQTIGSYVP